MEDKTKGIKARQIKNLIFKGFVIGISSIIIVPLFFIIGTILMNGISSISWEFLSSPMSGVIGKQGISNAIVGTLLLILIATIVSVPIGVFAGIYLSENRKSKISKYIRIGVEVLHGVPSVIMGLIGYMWIVLPMRGKFSAFAGGLSLGIMMFPVVIKSAEETLKQIPHTLKEASIALGVPYYRTMLKVIVPSAASGIVTGALLGVARVAGETAPLIFTAFGYSFFNANIFKPIDALPLIIYNQYNIGSPEAIKIVWGASFVLILFVLILNIITRLISKKWKIEF